MPERSPSRILLARPAGRSPSVGARSDADAPGAEADGQHDAAAATGNGATTTTTDRATGTPRAAGRAGTRRPGVTETGARRRDVVIDLTGTLPPRRGLSRAQRAGLVTLGVVAIVAVVLAITNFALGMRWRSQALTASARADEAAAETADVQRRLTQARADAESAESARAAMERQLEVSESDVAALEARVAALAHDRARAEDYGIYSAALDSDAQMRAVRAQIDSCVSQVEALRSELAADRTDGVPTLTETVSAAQAACEQAGADIDALAAAQ